jgi:Tol biopolymer transport system component
MTLAPGTRLGPYEIQADLGAGGMGEVYRAKDTRLGRTVAIKVLPAGAAADPERRRRFEQEARAASALNHPHICVLYDIGFDSPSTSSGQAVDFLVMEYLEGQTLAERLTKGPLPLDQALQVAVQIADALDKAHRQGIIHRDLKPGNVMLTKTGAARQGSPQAKLLDFGLAKLKGSGATTMAALSALPTQESPVTQKGTILGTLAYMAPEQLEGKEADARSDLFSFGAVLYEVLTGKRAFEGTSPASVITAIMSSDPPLLTALQPMTPPALDQLVKRCLAKDPDARWYAAHDVADELRWIAESAFAVTQRAGVVAPRRTRERMLWAAALVLAAIAAGVLVWGLMRTTTPLPPRVTRSVIPLGAGRTLSVVLPSVALSPDGTRLVYAAQEGAGPARLYVRALDQLTAVPLEGTQGALYPFFSPDGQWVAFVAEGRLRKVSLSGGAPVSICDMTPGMRGANWGQDGTILFTPGLAAGVWRVSAAGGTPQVVTTPDVGRREKSHRWPEMLPGGKAALVTVGTADISSFDDARIEVLLLDTGERRLLIEGGTYARYAPTGHVVYARAGSLLAVPFDLDTLKVTGAPVPIVRDVTTVAQDGYAEFGVARDGSLVYTPGGEWMPRDTLVWVDRGGKVQPATEDRRPFFCVRLSPDGKWLAASVNAAMTEEWIYDLVRGTFTRLTSGWDNYHAIWTPDGRQLTFSSTRGGGPQSLFSQPVDGSGEAERLTTAEHPQAAGSWSPDGRVLAFSEVDPSTGFDIWVLVRERGRKPEVFLRTRFNEVKPRFSPDGRWLAYVSDESDRVEVYVQPFPGPGRGFQISTGGGNEPVWARDGRELYYRRGADLMVTPVTTTAGFSAGQPRLLFRGPSVPEYGGLLNPNVGSFDVAPDGRRFVMIAPDESRPAATELNLVQNWFEELKAKVPVRR